MKKKLLQLLGVTAAVLGVSVASPLPARANAAVCDSAGKTTVYGHDLYVCRSVVLGGHTMFFWERIGG